MKKGLLCLFVLLVTQVPFMAAQYVDYYTWANEYQQKGKNEKAQKYYHKILDESKRADLKAGCLINLMQMYQESIPNDSLYLEYKKNLVRLGYENPVNGVLYTGFDQENLNLPHVDLYPISRELCCELYARGEFDTAWYYFYQYAVKYSSKGWCGVGKENNHLYDRMMEARLNAALGDTIQSFKPLLGYLTRADEPYEGSVDDYLAMFCFYNNANRLYHYNKKGDLLNELKSHLQYDGYRETNLYYLTLFKGFRLSFAGTWLPVLTEMNTGFDTLAVVDSLWNHTLLARSIQFIDQLNYDSLVSLNGRVSVNSNDVTLWTNFYLPIQLVGWNTAIKDVRDTVLTGKLVTEKFDNKSFQWNYDSELMFPEKTKSRKLCLTKH